MPTDFTRTRDSCEQGSRLVAELKKDDFSKASCETHYDSLKRIVESMEESFVALDRRIGLGLYNEKVIEKIETMRSTLGDFVEALTKCSHAVGRQRMKTEESVRKENTTVNDACLPGKPVVDEQSLFSFSSAYSHITTSNAAPIAGSTSALTSSSDSVLSRTPVSPPPDVSTAIGIEPCDAGKVQTSLSRRTAEHIVQVILHSHEISIDAELSRQTIQKVFYELQKHCHEGECVHKMSATPYFPLKIFSNLIFEKSTLISILYLEIANTFGWRKWATIEAESAFIIMDKDDSESISFDEFVDFACSHPYLFGPLVQLEKLFAAYDLNKDGVLSFDEVLTLLLEVQLEASEGEPNIHELQEKAKFMLNTYDKSHDSVLQFHEFCHMGYNHPELFCCASFMRRIFEDADTNFTNSLDVQVGIHQLLVYFVFIFISFLLPLSIYEHIDNSRNLPRCYKNFLKPMILCVAKMK